MPAAPVEGVEDVEAAQRPTEKFYTEGSQDLQWARKQVCALTDTRLHPGLVQAG